MIGMLAGITASPGSNPPGPARAASAWWRLLGFDWYLRAATRHYQRRVSVGFRWRARSDADFWFLDWILEQGRGTTHQ